MNKLITATLLAIVMLSAMACSKPQSNKTVTSMFTKPSINYQPWSNQS